MVDYAAKLAGRIADLERRLQSVERGYQLGRSGFADGTALPDLQLATNRAVEAAAQAVADASSALAKADGVVNTYFTDDGTPPSDPNIGTGDFWYRRDTKDTYQWDGEDWNPVTSTEVKNALAAAAAAEAAADGKISTYFQPNPPTGAGVGDIWFDTDDKNAQYRWSGTAWQPVRDGKIQDALDAAADASGKATTALNSANGKTRVVYSSNDPGGVQGTNNGDTWFTIDSSGTVLRQYQWVLPGAVWNQVQPQSVTVASLDAGKITTGTLAAGVTITIGTPGGNRVELRDDGLYGYTNGYQRIALGGSNVSLVADLIRSSGYVSNGASYVMLGRSSFGDNVDNITFARPGYNNAVLRNSLNTGNASLEVALQSGSSSGKSYYFDTSSFSTDGIFAIRNRTYDSGFNITNAISMNGSYGNMSVGGYYDNWYNTYGISLSIGYNNSGLQVTYPPNGAYGTTFLRNTYYGGGALKLTSDNAVQARDWNDNGYAYLRGIMQDQSNPDLKEHIVEINTDALAELSTVKRYAYDWKRYALNPDDPVPMDSSTGILLTEVPFSVQQTEDGYATGSYLGLLTAAINQLAGIVREEIQARQETVSSGG